MGPTRVSDGALSLCCVPFISASALGSTRSRRPYTTTTKRLTSTRYVMGEPRNTGSSFGGQDGMNTSSAIMAEGCSSPQAPQPQFTTAAAGVTASWRVRADVSHKGRLGSTRGDGHGISTPCAKPLVPSLCRGKPPQPTEGPILNPTTPDQHTTTGTSHESLNSETLGSVVSSTTSDTETRTNLVTTIDAGALQRRCESLHRDHGKSYSYLEVIQQVESMCKDFVSKDTTFDSPAGSVQLATLAPESRTDQCSFEDTSCNLYPNSPTNRGQAAGHVSFVHVPSIDILTFLPPWMTRPAG